jgi:hypothetical protein
MCFINCYYSEKDVKTFLWILEGIARGKDEGIFQYEDIKLKIKVEVLENDCKCNDKQLPGTT